MALKNTQIPITMTEYQKKMDEIIKKYNSFQIDECLMELLQEASRYRVVDDTITRTGSKRSNHISPKGKKVKKLKIYHDITCDCYDCRAGLSLRAKD